VDIPRSVKIRDVIKGEVADPVNVVFEIPLEEVKAVLQRDGWVEGVFEHRAELEGREPIYTAARDVVWIFVRFHIRLWPHGGVYLGNVHLDVTEALGHVGEHNVGRTYVAGLYALAGYCVEVVQLGPTEKFDGAAVKVFKCGKEERREV